MDGCTDTHILYHPFYFSLLAHHSTLKGTHTHTLSLPAKEVMEYVQYVVCEKPKGPLLFYRERLSASLLSLPPDSLQQPSDSIMRGLGHVSSC